MGIRELRDNLTSAVRRVRAGETIEVTHDGEPVAVLAPIGRSRIDEMIARGEVKPATMPPRSSSLLSGSRSPTRFEPSSSGGARG